MNTGPILIVVAHPDDEVLGAGGTIARFASRGRPVHVLFLADGESARHVSGVDVSGSLARRNAAAKRAARILGVTSSVVRGYPDNKLDTIALLDVVKSIEEVIVERRPTLVMTHHAGDVNVDHRITHEAVLAACRPIPRGGVMELWFFEVPSSTEWSPPGSGPTFMPNCFVDITDTLTQKLSALEAYSEELREFPHPRSLRAVEALARWRGATVGRHAAEAFMIGRSILSDTT
jgi:LmbE family N-acetylglucosaminyl deacetylase